MHRLYIDVTKKGAQSFHIYYVHNTSTYNTMIYILMYRLYIDVTKKVTQPALIYYF